MDKKELLDNLLNKTYCRLRPSKNHGIGVFAIKDIPKGVNPFETDDNEETIEITDRDIVGINPEVKKMIEDFSFLKEQGITEIFGAGTSIKAVADYIQGKVKDS